MAPSDDTRSTCSFCEKRAEYECSNGGDRSGCEDDDNPPTVMCEDHAYCDPISCIWRCEPCAEHYEEVDTEEALSQGPYCTSMHRWGPSFWALVDATTGEATPLRALLESKRAA